MADQLEGLWRLAGSSAWDEADNKLPTPYGALPMGTMTFAGGRMLAALCNGDAGITDRGFSSYGGPYTFDGKTLVTTVDIALDASRLGGQQIRGVVMQGADRMLMSPPPRLYGGKRERREIIWERVWRPA